MKESLARTRFASMPRALPFYQLLKVITPVFLDSQHQPTDINHWRES
jgi:hypothetical protein